MNTGACFYDIVAAARLLNSVYPDKQWGWFLSKNMNGLTEGYSTIPFNNESNELFYELNDLKDFAIEYGKGKFSSEDITLIINSHAKCLELSHKHEELNYITHAFTVTSDFICEKKFNADGTVDLRLESLSSWMVAIKKMSVEAILTCETLSELASEFRLLRDGNEISPSKAAELSAMAIEQALSVCDNAEQILSTLNY
jgi:hypothetical protein